MITSNIVAFRDEDSLIRLVKAVVPDTEYLEELLTQGWVRGIGYYFDYLYFHLGQIALLEHCGDTMALKGKEGCYLTLEDGCVTDIQVF
jgi:hypothetical protein